MTNRQMAEEILQKVGGKRNVISYSHCSTRLRLDLKDSGKIDRDSLDKLDGILSVMDVAGQTQIVLGPQVQYIYEELQGIFPQSFSASSEAGSQKKKGFLGSALEIISSLFTPLIDVLIGAGILKGLLSILTASGILTDAS